MIKKNKPIKLHYWKHIECTGLSVKVELKPTFTQTPHGCKVTGPGRSIPLRIFG